jgi:3-hydroxyisobutyrate dehydrogenase
MLASADSCSAVLTQILTRIASVDGLQLAGKTIINCSTISPEQSVALGAQVSAAGGWFIEAPVSGSVPHATAGTLTLLCGGPPEVLDATVPLLRVLGKPLKVGSLGQGSAVKLAVNAHLATTTAGFAFGTALTRRSGLPASAFLDVVRGGRLLHSPYLEFKGPALADRRFTPAHFTGQLLLKDLRLIGDAATAAGVDAGVLGGVQDCVQRALEQGYGDADFAAFYQVIDPHQTDDTSAALLK